MKIISLILKWEIPEKKHLTIHKQHLACLASDAS